ncbi:MAG TPA: hypothetical protein VFF68_09845, partial [Anaerolineaceae bacterium]|nr:hypothetical protein [Anaerolineaceae bacterium]
ALLVSRTLGYQVAEILGRLVDLAEAAGLRQSTRLGVGGMAITREAGAELGFDAVFPGELDMDAVIAFIEGRPFTRAGLTADRPARQKPDLTAGYSYQFRDSRIEDLLDSITGQWLAWSEGKTSDGIRRAELRRAMIACPEGDPQLSKVRDEYLALCDETIQAFYRQGALPAGVRRLGQEEIDRLPALFEGPPGHHQPLRHRGDRPLVFIQYGTGCPVMDALHARVSESWGADGLLHFDPSWGAQREGLLEGLLTHEHDGTILTLDNLRFIRHWMDPATLWNVRGHRGLNTPETQVLAHAAGADLLKINIPYGSTGGGTDPERLAVDGIYSVRLAAEFGLPFDIPGNDELSGVPPHKTFAGLLVMAMLGLKLGARPIPKPLLCLSPYMTVEGLMDDNLVEMNLAKLAVWDRIIDAPIWPGEPVGFMTHTPERVQSAVTTAAHVALAASAGVAAVTMASSDEAYSKGPISAQARVDSLRAVREMLRFMGATTYQRTPRSLELEDQLHAGIVATLEQIEQRGDFVAAIYEGLLGSREDGLYPGRIGRGTIRNSSTRP